MSDETQDDAVGYGKPPKSTQFKKGQSGNPKGRPKGATGFQARVQQELESTITVNQGGQATRISKLDAVIKRLVEKALKGDGPAIKMLVNLDAESSANAGKELSHTPESVELTQTDEAMLKYFADALKERSEVGHEANSGREDP